MGKSITDLSSVTTVGLDLAKHVFQVHGVDAVGRVIVAKALRRMEQALLHDPPALLAEFDDLHAGSQNAFELVSRSLYIRILMRFSSTAAPRLGTFGR